MSCAACSAAAMKPPSAGESNLKKTAVALILERLPCVASTWYEASVSESTAAALKLPSSS